MNCSSEKTHMVMLPFMAQGHIIPFLALAKQIQQRSHVSITIVSSPLNIHHLKSTASPSSTISFAELPFCSSDHGLPPNSENTDSLPLSQIIALFHASQTLQPSFHLLISEMIQQECRQPLCIISDVFMGWAVNVARSFDTPHFIFTTCGAFGTATYFSMWSHLPHRDTTSDEFSVPGFPETCKFRRSQLHPMLRAADGTDLFSKFFQKQISLSLGTDGMLCNTIEEIEPMGLDLLRKNTGLPVWTVGPLLPLSLLNRSSSSSSSSSPLNVSFSRSGKEPGIAMENCINWLNSHPPNSVLYIAFGSQNTISSTQMMELALGLELSGKPFIWVVRPPNGFDINAEFRAEWLPKGFEERVRKRKQGMVVHRWAPQLEILSHGSTGGFLSHCGWNSVLESLSQGVPIIGWPIAGEQAYNSKMMEEEMGVCVELTRGVESWVGKEEVERVVKMVMSKEGKGEEMKRKAMEIAKKIRDSVREDGDQKGSSLKALDDFLEALVCSWIVVD
ncbi:crocetin glucosyltransferase 3-like [Macadamia integrifolia]|uniref:crocetin glucosyltransferase 3-like n=1 Tax=Macadamia integrifolia TaxID=60698 RepID=UPI001C4E55D4|nr:crocetin glucosyltransferase 3-like [Macadamia integrifolia]